MTIYFPERDSAAARLGDFAIRDTLSIVMNRYIGENPALPFVYRCFSEKGIIQRQDGRYDLDLHARLPLARPGQLAYAYGLLEAREARTQALSITCHGPVQLWVNGVSVFKSTIAEEVSGSAQTVFVKLERGTNHLVLKFTRVPPGFGCLIGALRNKLTPLDILSPFAERKGQAGWVYSQATEWDASLAGFTPAEWETEAGHPIEWQPQIQSLADADSYCLAWTRLELLSGVTAPVRFTGAGRELSVYVDGRLIGRGQDGTLELEQALERGTRHVAVISKGDFQLQAVQGGQPLAWSCPHRVEGYTGQWLYLAGFSAPPVRHACGKLHILGLYGDGGELQPWRAGLTDCFVRPFAENDLFGRWNYPLGVTLYGILQAGRATGRPDAVQYAKSHIRTCVDAQPYARWFSRMYGYPSVNQQLMELEMLDDCGSLGSAMLEAYDAACDSASLEVADEIADFIMNRQERKGDGVFYREQIGYFMENTLWADDLYMSVPFLIRYARLRSRPDCLDEAVRQFQLFRQYLFMPETGLMSHVYAFKCNAATGVPWGRGNGWVLFSLAELLSVLPREHSAYPGLLEFYLELAGGALKAQGRNGLWHQVLTDEDSYEETSCTAMFVYAFSRGVRLGLFPQPGPYRQSAHRGWQGLARYSIDCRGNVYGVCQGSRFSFLADYYKHELPWRLNDTHGIGIVLLAGVEMEALEATRSE